MKINIQYEVREGPWGGANQFLKSLKNQLIIDDHYCNNPMISDFVIFNSHHSLEQMPLIKRANPSCRIMHRVDGPIYKSRQCSTDQDVNLLSLCNKFADDIIFQSAWSRDLLLDVCRDHKIIIPERQHTIINSADYSIFSYVHREIKNHFLISTWSDNMQKGFDVYKQIDDLLHLEKYSNIKVSFAGRSPIPFKHINIIPPLDTKSLSKLMLDCDGYITASRNDACSNALCESVQSGLKALVLRDGGNSEICHSYDCSHILFDNFSENVFDQFIELENKEHNSYNCYLEYLKIFKNTLDE